MAWLQSVVLRSDTLPWSSAVLWGTCCTKVKYGDDSFTSASAWSSQPILPYNRRDFCFTWLGSVQDLTAERWVGRWVAPCLLILYHQIQFPCYLMESIRAEVLIVAWGQMELLGTFLGGPQTIGPNCFHNNTEILFSFLLSFSHPCISRIF